jgi:F0F1-type ATP synthase assembly protein I
MTTDDEKTAASLEMLNKHLEEVKRLKPESESPAKLPGDAARSAIDFASATAVGTLLGYGFDAWQNTLPWGLLVGLLIGTGAGLKLMFQNEARERAKTGANKKDDV